MTTANEADRAGPGIGSYDELDGILPDDYTPILEPRETMEALYAAKRLIEDRRCEELNLAMVQVSLVVDVGNGINDYLGRDGSRAPVRFHISNDCDLHPMDTEDVQAATNREAHGAPATRDVGGRRSADQHGHGPQGLLPRSRRSAYVDQWDWEKAITVGQRTLDRSRNRPVTHDDAAASQGTFGRGERQRLAGGAHGDVRAAEHLRLHGRRAAPLHRTFTLGRIARRRHRSQLELGVVRRLRRCPARRVHPGRTTSRGNAAMNAGHPSLEAEDAGDRGGSGGC